MNAALRQFYAAAELVVPARCGRPPEHRSGLFDHVTKSPYGSGQHRIKAHGRIMDFEREPEPHWPKADMFVTKSGDLIIKVELSEIRSQDIEITVEAATLRIKGSRQDADAATATEVLRKDIPRGPYELLLKIPPGFNLSTAKAAFLNGTLRITVPANGSLPQTPRFSPGN